ncbi:helix-turn-helix domain-containing protein [Mucilaginibacter lappiensis]|uniref:AraC-like DNA-binding protein n=1 Tax=Mucilaginibacter lappiensis TaxID=354630 RepID=A0A841JMT4_9SPHI|nr:helix-turn-helix transcriptional regulator [Mucilaginibacter lappiensis]MBB6130906.1 AraC-like DNA-binding protein [Mucilaginibacter lappiensis]
MMVKLPDVYVSRKSEVVAQFKQILDNHIDDFMAGRVNKMYELKEMADIICLHPIHLSKVIKLETGHHACYFYEQRILLEAKKLLADRTLPIGKIAHRLDYDVSNFTKFFKRFMGMTPSLYRKTLEITT